MSGLSEIELHRWNEMNAGRDIISAYLSDTITVGDFNLVIGARYDTTSVFVKETEVLSSVQPGTEGWIDNFSSGTADAINTIIPRFTIPGLDPDYGWGFFSPRIGLVWDIGGKGTTTAKFSAGLYCAKSDLVSFTKGRGYRPVGANAWMNFWWMDDNGDGTIGFEELYWNDTSTYAAYRTFDNSGNFIGDWDDFEGTFWGDYNPLNPTQLTDPSRTIADDAQRGPRARELAVTLEHELMTNFMIGVNFTYKIYDNYNWNLSYWPDTGKLLSKDDYVEVGTIPSTIGGQSTGEAAGKPYYLLNAAYTNTQYSMEVQRPDYNHKY